MSNKMLQLVPANTARSYTTREGAIKAAERLFEGAELHPTAHQIRYVVAAREDGRFAPVFFCVGNDRSHQCMFLAHKGFQAVA